MARDDAEHALHRLQDVNKLRQLKMVVFALLFLSILNSNAEMHNRRELQPQ